ncbi:N-acetylmuramic acid 6-phosphate etherase [Bryocella elongata]|uniref:N-acetylmuramic acid 6-phosphate etherase n=1 Tax=Bryocella elongata TaxID=863522 RepID=A0A1H6BHQ7_9BACT|nr:N-acetylmuramic acid 6-phosphate etherase [Bryocella elongata]SEG60132.1 N-acetylmuramic acid 6-phosphate etherase [Bryocella elongata]
MAAPANVDLAKLVTESRNPATNHLDELPTLQMLELINDEDAKVAHAVRNELPFIAKAVDEVASRFERGGRLFYIGAGTSGRLGVLDASECPPTFNVSADLVQGLIAGGDGALRLSSEHSEDSPEEGARDLGRAGFAREGRPDVVVGIAASGRTPYVLGAINYAKMMGCLTIGLSCVPHSELAMQTDLAITPFVGPEVVTGSTRLKAGTATKLVLNMLSTGVMVRTGATYGNLMVNVRPTNAKLVARAHRIIAEAAEVSLEKAAELLPESGSDVKTAIVMGRLNLPRREAEAALGHAHGVLARVLHPEKFSQ